MDERCRTPRCTGTIQTVDAMLTPDGRHYVFWGKCVTNVAEQHICERAYVDTGNGWKRQNQTPWRCPTTPTASGPTAEHEHHHEAAPVNLGEAGSSRNQ